jgi:hypothetical protein
MKIKFQSSKWGKADNYDVFLTSDNTLIVYSKHLKSTWFYFINEEEEQYIDLSAEYVSKRIPAYRTDEENFQKLYHEYVVAKAKEKER